MDVSSEKSKIERLAKSDNGKIFTKSKKESDFEHRRQKIIRICASLRKSCSEYLAQKTAESIETYIASGDRVIYSEITNIVYSMSPEEQATFNTNLDTLMNYVLNNDSKVPEEVQNITIKLWDHTHLAMRQMGNAREILEKSTEETKEKLHDELYKEFKGIEREYITILGIFASIIVSFVGGITFSTSVLENMHNVSIYRLTFVILLLAFSLLNTINLLVRYIFRLNKGEDAVSFPMWQLNLILAVLLLLLVVCWTLNIHDFPKFLSELLQLPWVNAI